MSLIQKALRLVPLDRQAMLVARTLPRSCQYHAAATISRLHGRVRGLFGGNAQLSEAFMLDFWLRSLTFCGPFPIPYTLQETAALQDVPPGQGVLMCSTHTPLIQVAVRAVTELGYKTTAIADPGNIVDGNQVLIYGLAQRAAAFPADRHCLLRLRTVLRAGGTAVSLVDAAAGSELSGAAMRLAGTLHCRTVFASVELRPRGAIAVFFNTPPFPYNRSAAEVEANLNVLRAENRRIFTSLGRHSASNQPPNGVEG